MVYKNTDNFTMITAETEFKEVKIVQIKRQENGKNNTLHNLLINNSY